jgi:DNA-binding transcriptional ArsR family regulator
MNEVFRALADRTRRAMLDKLFKKQGLTLAELCQGQPMSRQAVSKHLAILEDAGLVVAVWRGREKRHFLNPMPVQEISERWIAKYARERLQAVSSLKRALEETSEKT